MDARLRKTPIWSFPLPSERTPNVFARSPSGLLPFPRTYGRDAQRLCKITVLFFPPGAQRLHKSNNDNAKSFSLPTSSVFTRSTTTTPSPSLPSRRPASSQDQRQRQVLLFPPDVQHLHKIDNGMWKSQHKSNRENRRATSFGALFDQKTIFYGHNALIKKMRNKI